MPTRLPLMTMGKMLNVNNVTQPVSAMPSTDKMLLVPLRPAA